MFDVLQNEKFIVVKRVLINIRKNLNIIKHNYHRTKEYNQ